MRCFRVLKESFVSFLIHPPTLVNLGDYHVRLNSVDPDTLLSEFQSSTARELIDAGFRYAISQHSRKLTQSGDAGDIDDVAPCLDEMWRCQLHHVKDRPKIDAHHGVPRGQGSIFDRAA